MSTRINNINTLLGVWLHDKMNLDIKIASLKKNPITDEIQAELNNLDIKIVECEVAIESLSYDREQYESFQPQSGPMSFGGGYGGYRSPVAMVPPESYRSTTLLEENKRFLNVNPSKDKIERKLKLYSESYHRKANKIASLKKKMQQQMNELKILEEDMNIVRQAYDLINNSLPQSESKTDSNTESKSETPT